MSTLDFRDLPDDRLATTDKEGNRLWIIPFPVHGVWKKRKTLFHICLLAIFVLTPWLRWNGSPLLLFDIASRQFVFFGRVFAAHDAPLLFFLLGIAGFLLIVATALYGRVWCGWACPQTVFIEQVFRRIESLVVGSRGEQIAANKQPLKWRYLKKLFLKWLLFVLVSLFLAHSFIAYFVPWEKLLQMMQAPPAESWTVFVLVMSVTALILFDFAWFREQFCIIMCPYGRFQSVLMDQNSITVAYDYKRGEPRSQGLKGKQEKGAGDCIDCFKCVSVCPTGIDIRRGQQLECIGCTACIDACDEVMEKIQRPKGLIRYAALADFEKQGRVFWRPRLIGYFAILVLLFGGLIFSLRSHQEFYFNILRQNQRPYVEAGDDLLNNFRIHLKNPSFQKMRYRIFLEVSSGEAGIVMAPPLMEGEVESNEGVQKPFFVRIKNWRQVDTKNFAIVVEYFNEENSKNKSRQDINLVFPK